MKQLRLAMPIILVILAAMNIAFNYTVGNDNAVWANISALCAWMIVAGDEVVKFLNEREKSM